MIPIVLNDMLCSANLLVTSEVVELRAPRRRSSIGEPRVVRTLHRGQTSNFDRSFEYSIRRRILIGVLDSVDQKF